VLVPTAIELVVIPAPPDEVPLRALADVDTDPAVAPEPLEFPCGEVLQPSNPAAHRARRHRVLGMA
jgi:hypothetical protein